MTNKSNQQSLQLELLGTTAPYVGRSNRSAPHRDNTLVDKIIHGEYQITKPLQQQAPPPAIEDIIKQVPPEMLQAIKDWEALEERESKGWGPDGGPKKPPKVKGSDIMKARAIMKAMELRKTLDLQAPPSDKPRPTKNKPD